MTEANPRNARPDGRPCLPGHAATSGGSLPGSDPLEATRLVFGELGALPFLPELPGRGVHAQMVGRGAALLVSLPAEVMPSGWRLCAHSGRDARRALDLLSQDLDALETVAGEHRGVLKVQLCGPWTLAASLELPSGHRVLTDHGAVRDLIASLTEGVGQHLDQLRRRLPHASVVVQLDEPLLSPVLAGHLPTASGYGTVPAIETALAISGLREVLGAVPAGGRVVHSCEAEPPLAVLAQLGADALSLDLSASEHWPARRLDALAGYVDTSSGLLAGVVESVEEPTTTLRRPAEYARDLLALWRKLGQPVGSISQRVVVSTTCGMAGASAEHVRAAFRTVSAVADELAEAAA